MSVAHLGHMRYHIEDPHDQLSGVVGGAVKMEVSQPLTTEAGLEVDRSYNPRNTKFDYDDIADPGSYPFTRGNFAGGYRDRPWTIRQYSGFGTAEESNARYKMLLEQGGSGLSVAADLPTQIGYDSDDPDVVDEVGRVGVALDTLADVEILFDGISLDAVSTSWTINGTAAIMLAFYVATARKQGVAVNRLRGTIQNDILKEYVARGTWIWPADPSIRLIADTVEFCAEHIPRYNAISVAGAHFRDAGATAVQEMAFTLADAVAYVDAVVARGRVTIDDFAPQVSFFFYTHNDFFEEIAKYRAGRRRWARIVRERYGATQDASCMFRVGCVAGGSTLQAPQAQNNIVRVAYQALASVLGGVQSMFTAAWDEPFALPTQESAMLALRTQQVLAEETGVTRTVDPLGGSWFVESLTDAMEEEVIAVMDDLAAHGGMVRAIEDGYVQGLIGEQAWKTQREAESGERRIVGVNVFTSPDPRPDVQVYGLDEAGRQRQLDRLRQVKRSRDGTAVRRALAELETAARVEDRNLMPLLVDAVEAYCSVGEIVSVLKDVWGEYRQPVVV
jgi:methylmalonyl-CoA mutase N-terminal domain/subunit